MKEAKIGDRVSAFQWQRWVEAGGDQPGGNGQFYEPGTVEDVRLHEDGDYVADVRLDTGKLSRSHFVWALEKVTS